ncbi:hypothetical protein [Kibdelosporangium phytohabitans]|uniref:hypothetical protein n=1 Tax=Kibdelosporangium phytohabitans TaxID=860235 RepID=UPI000A49B7B7|nr:hypothetical protein [Kibdelosporangium phytohabitans]MBE1469105.1 hypothetical protein [Kibdelosporangium phytohabitans]
MAIDAQRRQELTNAIGIALLDAAPGGWRRIDLQCLAAGDMTLTVLLNHGSAFTPPVPDEARDGMLRLRQAMAEPGKGTWRSSRVIIDPPGRICVKYNLDWDPVRLTGNTAAPAVRERLGFEEQDRIRSLVANLVVNSGPVDWSQVMITCRAVGDHTELSAMVRRATDGGPARWAPRTELAALLAELRAGMYRPGRGDVNETSAHVHLDPWLDSTYPWDREPACRPRPPSCWRSPISGAIPRWCRSGWPIAPGGPRSPALAVESESGTSAKQALIAAGQAAAGLGLDPARYRVGEVADGAWCLVPHGDRWSVFRAQGERRIDAVHFRNGLGSRPVLHRAPAPQPGRVPRRTAAGRQTPDLRVADPADERRRRTVAVRRQADRDTATGPRWTAMATPRATRCSPRAPSSPIARTKPSGNSASTTSTG